MLNALANHGFLPRDGLNIDQDQVVVAFNKSINFIADSLVGIVQTALTTSTTGNSSTFNLADTAEHDVIEHDGSLSRNDIYFGDNLDFDPEIWATTVAYFTDEVVSIEVAATARANRVTAAKVANPEFNLTDPLLQNSYFETSLYLVSLGDKVEGNAPTEWVKVLFGERGFPPCTQNITLLIPFQNRSVYRMKKGFKGWRMALTPMTLPTWPQRCKLYPFDKPRDYELKYCVSN
jgi:hypothetical protein